MGSKDASSTKPATAVDAPAEAAAPATKQEAATPAAKQEATGKGKLYTVASPIKHDGEDYGAGDAIRLPEATAARLAGYLKA